MLTAGNQTVCTGLYLEYGFVIFILIRTVVKCRLLVSVLLPCYVCNLSVNFSCMTDLSWNRWNNVCRIHTEVQRNDILECSISS